MSSESEADLFKGVELEDRDELLESVELSSEILSDPNTHVIVLIEDDPNKLRLMLKSLQVANEKIDYNVRVLVPNLDNFSMNGHQNQNQNLNLTVSTYPPEQVVHLLAVIVTEDRANLGGEESGTRTIAIDDNLGDFPGDMFSSDSENPRESEGTAFGRKLKGKILESFEIEAEGWQNQSAYRLVNITADYNSVFRAISNSGERGQLWHDASIQMGTISGDKIADTYRRVLLRPK